MDQLLDILAGTVRANQLALDLTSRQPPFKAIVTQNRDPKEMRRILVTEPAAPGINSYWVRRLRSESQTDAIMPKIGQEVLVIPVDGDFIDGYYLIVEGDTDPPFNKIDGNRDRRQQVPGNEETYVGQNRKDQTSRDVTELIGRDLKRDVRRNVLDTIAGTFTAQVKKAVDIFSNISIKIHLANLSYLELKLTGEINLRTPIGSGFTFTPDGQLTLFISNINILPPVGSSGTSTPINLGGRTIQLDNGSLVMTDMDNVKINTKDVATVGANTQTGGNVITKGWT